MLKILLTEKVHPVFFELLQGFYIEEKYDFTDSWMLENISQYDILVLGSKLKLDYTYIYRAKKLKLVARPGSGLDNIDRKALEERGIKLVSSPQGNANAVAEHVLGLLIGLTKNIVRASIQVGNEIWLREENRGTELAGKTFAIMGYGNVGQRLAKKLLGFDMKLLVYDKYKKGFGGNGIHEVGMAEIYEEAEIVSLHLPLTQETHHLADKNFFNSFKKPIGFINTSRGAVHHTRDLIEALQNKRVSFAALDVLENEQLKDMSPTEKQDFATLIKLPNVLVTPHIAGWSQESLRNCTEIIANNINDYAK